MERIKQKQSKGYMIVDYGLCAKYGPNLTNFICNLVNKYYYWQKNNENFNGSFFITHADQTGQIGLSGKQIRRCKEQAKLNGWIRTYYDGYPKKEWYIINMQSPDIQSLIPFCNPHSLQKVTFIGDKREPLINSSVPKSNELVCEEEKNTHTNNSFSVKKKIHNAVGAIKDSESPTKKDSENLKTSVFVSPTLGAVQTYCAEAGKEPRYAKEFYDYWTEMNWKKEGKSIVSIWKAKFLSWCNGDFKKKKEEAYISVNNGTMTKGERELMYGKKQKGATPLEIINIVAKHQGLDQYEEFINPETGEKEFRRKEKRYVRTPGDLIQVTNPETGKTELKPVEGLIPDPDWKEPKRLSNEERAGEAKYNYEHRGEDPEKYLP